MQRYIWDGSTWLLLGGMPGSSGNLPNGPALPATCGLGDVFVLTTGDIGLYVCDLLPNMWHKTGQVGPIRFLHQPADPVIANYQQWLVTVPTGAEQTIAKAVTSGGGPLQLESGGQPIAFITPAGEPGAQLILAGTWECMCYLGVSASGGISSVVAHVFKRATNDVETELFTVTSPQVNGAAATFYDFETVQPQFTLDPTDRLGVKFFAQTTAGAAKTLTLFYESAAHASHVHLPPLGL